MSIHSIEIESIIPLLHQYPIIDVRSPSEYMHAHIPQAHNIPLFSDEERAIVGTTYKNQGRAEAIKVGTTFFGPKMKVIIEAAEKIAMQASSKKLIVHCWRGGMRSGAIAWLLSLYGLEIILLKGGYKRFRNWCIEQFSKTYPLIVLGGFTGSGKTYTLHELKKQHQTTLDLEDLAGNKGSTFGNLGLPPQPSAEQFENNLALALFNANQHLITNNNAFIWIENESQRIGNVNIPTPFFLQTRAAVCLFMEVSIENRLELILKDYGHFPKQELANAIKRLEKRMGGLNTKIALDFLADNNLRACFSILLDYYDRTYTKSSFKENRKIIKIKVDGNSPEAHAKKLIEFIQYAPINQQH